MKTRLNMKRYDLILTVFLALFLLSCDKKTENMSRPTYYVAFEIKGDNPVIMQVGDKYVDAGAIATLHGEDVTSAITVKSNVVDDEMGLYRVEYSAVNNDGLMSKAVRNVIVCNPDVTADISGVWNVSEETYRKTPSAETLYGGEGYTVKINYIAPGFFYVSDFLAGWYAVRANYGASYAVTGYVALNEDNTIELLSSYVAPWDMGLDFLDNGVYEPANDSETVKFEAGFNGIWTFYVKLTKDKE